MTDMMRLSPARSLSARFVAGLLLLVVFAGQAMAQIDDVKKRSEDAFQELESGKLTLRFLNALNGEGIAGGTVLIADDSLLGVGYGSFWTRANIIAPVCVFQVFLSV